MGLKEAFENHPVGLGLGSFVAGVGLATGLVWPLVDRNADNQRERLEVSYEAEIDELERSLNSIERRVGGGPPQHILVDDMLIGPAEAQSVSGELESFPEDSFFALMPDAAEGWSFERTDEQALLLETTGLSKEDLDAALGIDTDALASSPPWYRWRHETAQVVEGVDGLQLLVPQVLLQHLPLSEPGADEPGDGDGDPLDLSSLYRGDVTAQFLGLELSSALALSEEGTVRLATIDKRENVVYARIETTFEDVVVDGVGTEELHWDRELIAISTPEDLYLIRTAVPSADRRSPHATWINRWMASLRIVIDPS